MAHAASHEESRDERKYVLWPSTRQAQRRHVSRPQTYGTNFDDGT